MSLLQRCDKQLPRWLWEGFRGYRWAVVCWYVQCNPRLQRGLSHVARRCRLGPRPLSHRARDRLPVTPLLPASSIVCITLVMNSSLKSNESSIWPRRQWLATLDSTQNTLDTATMRPTPLPQPKSRRWRSSATTEDRPRNFIRCYPYRMHYPLPFLELQEHNHR